MEDPEQAHRRQYQSHLLPQLEVDSRLLQIHSHWVHVQQCDQCPLKMSWSILEQPSARYCYSTLRLVWEEFVENGSPYEMNLRMTCSMNLCLQNTPFDLGAGKKIGRRQQQ
jgi:hypothetical protein